MIETDNLIITKFGGTSVKTAEAMRSVLSILQKQKENKIVVLSACGGFTNLILECLQKSLVGESVEANLLLETFENHHTQLINELIFDNDLKSKALKLANNSFKILRDSSKGTALLRDLSKIVEDKCVAQGEILSTLIFYYYTLSNHLEVSLLDIRKLITKVKHNNNEIDIKVNKDELSKILKESHNSKMIITQGFICNDEYGNTTNLGRGGSDWTAAILGSELKAKEIQIWTDVNGIFTTDPRLISSAKTILEMNFKEVQALSFYGAKVLHPETIKPAILSNIPILVLNTFDSQEKGTKIVSYNLDDSKEVKAVTLNTDCSIYYFELSNNQNKRNDEVINIFKRLNSLQIIYYLFELRDNQLIIVINKNIALQKYFEMYTFEVPFKTLNVELIACIGFQNNILSKENKLLSFFNAKDCLIFNYNIETKIFVSVFLPERGNDFYNFIHQFTIE